MSDTAPMPDAEARCHMCRMPIPRAARKCHQCGSRQGRLRVLDLLTTSLALVIALISVLTVTVPILLTSIRGGYSTLTIDAPHVHDEYVTLIARNTGTRPAVITSAQLVFAGFYDDGSALQPLPLRIDPRLIQPEGATELTLNPVRPLPELPNGAADVIEGHEMRPTLEIGVRHHGQEQDAVIAVPLDGSWGEFVSMYPITGP